FKAEIDIEHGIALRIQCIDDDYVEDLYFENVEIDIPLERKEPDLTGREIVEGYYGENGGEWNMKTENISTDQAE
ncbi:MAG: hypothetical protein GXY08_03620, partial [Ruminococcus sp.]|nr:hypothetical protein [Ruminococcus sp.]